MAPLHPVVRLAPSCWPSFPVALMAVPETEMVEVRREGLADLRVTRADLGTVQAAVQAVDLGNRDSASPLNHREATKLHASPQGFS
jgi:hypothetical protein